MAKREKFGKFILLEEVDTSGLGQEYRAAKLGSAGLEKIVSVLRLRNALSTQADAVKSLMDQVKFAAQLQNPNVLKIYGIGKVDSSYYISYEFLEGKSLKAIFNRCRQEGFPFSVDHALLITSKICSALEYAHGRKNESGGRYFHGLVTPSSALVSYEGEVRLRGFGYWHSRIRDAGGVLDEEALYLAPEQAAGGAGDTKSDTFAVGALLFETLTGEPFFQGGRTEDIAGRLAQARLQSPMSDDDSLPKPVAEILHRSLTRDPGVRYAEIQEMRKAVDTLLFSGDFTPTTFNLAFFMHSLFREDIERESKTLKEEKEASYLEYLTEGPTVRLPAPSSPAQTEPPELREVPATVLVPAAAVAFEPPPPPPPPPPREVAPPAVTLHEPAPALSPKEAAAGFTFHREAPKSKMPLVAGGAAALLVAGGLAIYFLGRRGGQAPATPATTAPTTLTTEAEAALVKVKQLQDELAKMKAEQEAAGQKAAEDIKKKMQEQAAKTGATVDPAQLQKQQEEAARKARLDAEKKQQEELKRLEDAKKAEEARLAEEQRRVEEQRKAEEEAARLAAATTTLPPPTTAPAAPAIRPGTLVNISDPGVIAPVLERRPTLLYPPLALRQRLEGTVELNVLVDEKGLVVDAQVVTGAGGKAGLNEAAIEHVKKSRYRPATKDGVPVKVWIPVRVQFKL